MLKWFSKFLKNNKTKIPPRFKFEVGTFIIHIPEFVDNTEVGKILYYNDFGFPVCDKFIATGHIVPFSPIALEAILKLTPLERLAILSPHIIPIHTPDVTINFETLSDGIDQNSVNAANEWYGEQPVNQIEIIAEQIRSPNSTKPRRRKVKKIQTTPRPEKRQPKNIIRENPDL